MSEKLKPCPCGKVPTNLVLEEGATCKYAYCGGNCCGGWLVEFPTGYAHVSSYAAMELAIPAWNGAMRKEMPTPESLAEKPFSTRGQITKEDELESLRIKLSVAVKAGKALRMENERLRAGGDCFTHTCSALDLADFPELRKGRGLTQEKASELLGVTRGYLGHVEIGSKVPGLNFAARVAETFRVPVKLGRFIISVDANGDSSPPAY